MRLRVRESTFSGAGHQAERRDQRKEALNRSLSWTGQGRDRFGDAKWIELCVFACAHACVRLCVFVFLRLYLRVCLRACVCLPTCVLACGYARACCSMGSVRPDARGEGRTLAAGEEYGVVDGDHAVAEARAPA